MKPVDKVGKICGRLVVIEVAKDHKNRRAWKCCCSCGQTTVVLATNLRIGHTESCGCLQREIARQGRFIHGEAQTAKRICTPEYRAWSHAKSRCYDKNDKRYSDYGGRGIVMCDRWRLSYAAFLEDMGYRPIGRFSLDRINVNGSYEPKNCRWATDIEQARNKRKYKTLFHLN